MTEPKIILIKDGRTAASTSTDQISALNLPDVPITPGDYTNANITVDQKGRVTAVESSSKYTTVYYEDFLYEGTPFGLLPDLILVEPPAGEILFGDQSCISINIFNSEVPVWGSIKKVTGNPLNHKITCAFKHSVNDLNMRNMAFSYTASEGSPGGSEGSPGGPITIYNVAIVGGLVGSDYTLKAVIQNSAGQHTQTLGVVTDTLNTISIEFTDSNVIFTLNETATTIPNSHPNMPEFTVFHASPLEFAVFSITTLPTPNRVDIDFLKVEKKNG